MWKKIKVIGIFIALIAVTIAGFIFGSRSKRPGVSRADDLNRDITGGLGRVQDSVDGVAGNLRQGSEKTGKIVDGISNTETKLRSALEILRNAKEKTKTSVD